MRDRRTARGSARSERFAIRLVDAVEEGSQPFARVPRYLTTVDDEHDRLAAGVARECVVSLRTGTLHARGQG